MPTCDFRTKPIEHKSTLTKNMTKDEVIEKLKNCIQQQDPAFRKRFLDFSKELNGRINGRDFKKGICEHKSNLGDYCSPRNCEPESLGWHGL